MADGRMLKKVVSDSKKLAELKSDSARLLWTWILPYLDIEGRYYADPDIIKGKVVPRLKTFNAENIAKYLNEMNDIGLIVLFEHEDEKYLEYRNFKEFQNLRESKEAKSKIPPPNKLQDNSRTTPVLLPNNLIKENLIKDNLKGTTNVPFEVPTKEQIEEASDPMILSQIEKICEQLYQEKIFLEVHAFKNKMFKEKKNMRSILHTLVRAYLKREFKQGAWAYCLETIKKESQNYNARDYAKTSPKGNG